MISPRSYIGMGLIAFVMAMVTVEVAQAQPDWAKTLLDTPPAYRYEVARKEAFEKKSERDRTIFLKYGAFQLDRAYVPLIKGARGHILIQLNGPLNEETSTVLTSLDVKLLKYLPYNTWIASVPKNKYVGWGKR